MQTNKKWVNSKQIHSMHNHQLNSCHLLLSSKWCNSSKCNINSRTTLNSGHLCNRTQWPNSSKYHIISMVKVHHRWCTNSRAATTAVCICKSTSSTIGTTSMESKPIWMDALSSATLPTPKHSLCRTSTICSLVMVIRTWQWAESVWSYWTEPVNIMSLDYAGGASKKMYLKISRSSIAMKIRQQNSMHWICNCKPFKKCTYMLTTLYIKKPSTT